MAETQTSVSASRAGDATYDDASPSRIKADIDQTRAEMDETIDRLGRELQPRRIMEELMNAFNINGRDMARQAGCIAQDTGQALWRSIRENPLPLALIGVGIGWLAMKQSGADQKIAGKLRHRRYPVGDQYSAVDARTGEPYTASYGEEFSQPDITGTSQFGEQSSGSVGEKSETLGEKASHMGEKMKEQGRSMLSSAKDKLSQLSQKFSGGEGGGMKEKASEQISEMRERVRHGMERTREKLSHGKESASHTLEDYPLAIGGIAMLLGLTVGSLLPRTRQENRILGEKADELKRRARDRARQASHEVMERGKEVVETGVEAASDEAQRQFSADELRRRSMD